MLLPIITNPYANGKCPKWGILLQENATNCPFCSQKDETSKQVSMKITGCFYAGF